MSSIFRDPSASTSTNVTKCANGNNCNITGLKPMTKYSVTVFVVSDKTIKRPHKIAQFSTTQAGRTKKVFVIFYGTYRYLKEKK